MGNTQNTDSQALAPVISASFARYNLNRMHKAGVVTWLKGDGDQYFITITATAHADEHYLHLLWKNVAIFFRALECKGIHLHEEPGMEEELERIREDEDSHVTYEIRGIGNLQILANDGVIFPDFTYYKTQALTLPEIIRSALHGTVLQRITDRLLTQLNFTPRTEYVLGIPR